MSALTGGWLSNAVVAASIVVALVGLVVADVFMVSAYRQEDYSWMLFQAALAALNCVILTLNAAIIVLRVRIWWILRRARRQRLT